MIPEEIHQQALSFLSGGYAARTVAGSMDPIEPKPSPRKHRRVGSASGLLEPGCHG